MGDKPKEFALTEKPRFDTSEQVAAAVGGRVRVYRNLARDSYSVMAMEGPDKGRVVAWAKEVFLDDVKFVVRESGRQRVLNERRKNVHAFVDGKLTSDQPVWDIDETVRVRYNPYVGPHFMDDCHQPLAGAGCVLMDSDFKMYAGNPQRLG